MLYNIIDKESLIRYLKYEGFDARIVDAFEKIKRENFIPENLKNLAYENMALPLEENATISQPYTIAFMLQSLELNVSQKVLEIGSGSGYVLALIEAITDGKTYGVEIIPSLAVNSKKVLNNNKKIKIIARNGENGLPEHAPFDRIIITASLDKIPQQLYSQLNETGILVCPVKNSIFKIKKTEGKFVPFRKN